MSDLASYRARRRADIELWRAAKRVRRNRSHPREMRRAAWKISAAFFVRIALGWHAPPRPWLEEIVGEFTYGRFCGVGHGVPDGEDRAPLDALDAACKVHDDAYAVTHESGEDNRDLPPTDPEG